MAADVQYAELMLWGKKKERNQATEVPFYAINDFHFALTFSPVQQSKVQKAVLTEN